MFQCSPAGQNPEQGRTPRRRTQISEARRLRATPVCSRESFTSPEHQISPVPSYLVQAWTMPRSMPENTSWCAGYSRYQ